MTGMPLGTVGTSGGALPSWLENTMIVPLFSPLEICIRRAEATARCWLASSKSSSFSLTNTKFFSCSRADARSCDPGGKPEQSQWEHVCLKRRKEDFREAMRTGRIRFFLAGKIPHDGVRDFATQPFGWKAKPFGIGNSSND